MAHGGIPISEQVESALIISTLKKNNGVISKAARELGLHRDTLTAFFNSSEELKEILKKARLDYVTSRLDICEEVMDTLMTRIDDDPNHAFKSAMYILNNHGKDRGYAHPDAVNATEAQEKGYKEIVAQMKANQAESSARKIANKSISEEQ